MKASIDAFVPESRRWRNGHAAACSQLFFKKKAEAKKEAKAFRCSQRRKGVQLSLSAYKNWCEKELGIS